MTRTNRRNSASATAAKTSVSTSTPPPPPARVVGEPKKNVKANASKHDNDPESYCCKCDEIVKKK